MEEAAPPLLTLRDLLELACESSCSDGFRSYPRRLPLHGDDAVQQAEAEAAPVGLLIESDLRRSPSRTLSSILFPRNPRSVSVAAISRLSRSLSRRLVFWRRHREDDDDDDATSDTDERDSLALPSPVVSSCCASECAAASEAEAADELVQEAQAASGASDESEMPSTSSGCTGSVDDGAADGDGHNKELDGDPVDEKQQQQLSPVSVLDFPFHGEDEEEDDRDQRSDAGACSPTSSQQCQPDDIQRSSNSARELHKIRRLDGPALHAAVDPVDLDTRFDESGESDDTQAQSNSSISTSTDDSAATASTPPSPDEPQPQRQQSTREDAESEPDAHHHRLFARLLKEVGKQAAASVSATERLLLLDFFAEGLHRRRSLDEGPVLGTVKPSDDRDEYALVRAAREWVHGAGTQWGVEDVLFSGAAALADMDRERRWMCVGVEEREVGVAVDELLLDALLAELVSDLAERC